MFGHHWEKAEATIVLRQVKGASGSGATTVDEFVADVRPASGAPFRATIQEPTIATNFWSPSVGDVVSVLIDAERGKVKFDKDDPRLNCKARLQEHQRNFDAVAAQAPGTQAEGRPFGASPVAAQVLGTQFVQMGMADASPLMADLLSGDARRRAAAVESLRAAQQAAAGTAAWPGAESSGSAAGASAGDPTARLAKLESLKQAGMVTDEEYAAQRMRILDGI